MAFDLVLASGSQTRASLLRAAGLLCETRAPKLDETAVRQALEEEHTPPRDVADVLAEMKARKVALQDVEAPVLGCDQVLDLDGQIFEKPRTIDEARDHLEALRGKSHNLHSAAVLFESGAPVWRTVSVARMTMRDLSDAFLTDYLKRNWPGVGTSVGAYHVEAEGVRLFTQIQGDHFTILGLPMIPLLNYLGTTGRIPS